ncbi:CYTH domain-containing protein [Marinobacter alexandrii]|uniref:CYTH domain-containing protein n=1 Tax=Marinobacter alexandrii TaxID=2570351 RepID=UPI001FFE62CC|nr:CYTH domain-containing protein [Marinobacter alexandrii]MCK2149760.1 CYTH domain-containing protein [Marinobacter alexandrii]
MAVELEIKLTLTEASLAQATKWLANRANVVPAGTKKLRNCYYDTPLGSLNERRIALRLRQQDDQFIQTLKTKGEFSGGAHRRNEWEWTLPSAALDISLLADTPLAGDEALEHLQPVFETNFERQIFMLHRDGAEIEVAVDHGSIMAGDKIRPLYEVEFELKSGEPEVLLRSALELAEQVPVFLNLVSKAEQGYLLAGQYLPEVAVAKNDGSPVSVTGFLEGLSVAWMRGIVYPVSRVDLSEVSSRAAKAGLSDQLNEVLSDLDAGTHVPELAAKGSLGSLQIRLATA